MKWSSCTLFFQESRVPFYHKSYAELPCCLIRSIAQKVMKLKHDQHQHSIQFASHHKNLQYQQLDPHRYVGVYARNPPDTHWACPLLLKGVYLVLAPFSPQSIHAFKVISPGVFLLPFLLFFLLFFFLSADCWLLNSGSFYVFLCIIGTFLSPDLQERGDSSLM